MTDGNWGLARERARKSRRWMISGVMAASGFALLLLPHDASAQTKAIAMACWAGVVLVGEWISWRERDEVERRMAINSWAAMGFTSLILFPLSRIAEPLVHVKDMQMIVWLLSAGALLVTYTAQRLRG